MTIKKTQFVSILTVVVCVSILGFILFLGQQAEAVGTKSLGEACSSSAECFSYYCDNGVCSCYADGYNNCFYPSHCCSGNCVNNTCMPKAECQTGAVRCIETIVDSVAKGKMQECVGGVWELQNDCAGSCKDSVSCGDSVEEFDASCTQIMGSDVAFLPQGAVCTKNSFSGACDGAGHCVISANSGCVVSVNGNLVPQSAGVVCFSAQEGINGVCDGHGNCVVGGGGGNGGGNGGGGCQVAGTENCCNGKDDDCNGQIDGDDTACSGASKITNLQAGINYPCWNKPSQYDLFNKTFLSPVFTCPQGYWARLKASILPRSYETVKVKDANNNSEFDHIVQSIAKPNYNVILPSNRINIEYIHGSSSDKNNAADSAFQVQYGASNLGVKINSLECILPKDFGCTKCGETGILWGIFNVCDKDECAALGSECYFKPGGTLSANQCYYGAEVKMTLLDAATQGPLSGVRIIIAASDDYCITDDKGTCSMNLGLGGKYTAIINQAGYVCGQNTICQRDFEVSADPMSIGLIVNKIITCNDTDADDQHIGGRNYSKAGLTSETFGLFLDICTDAFSLKEYYCENNKAVSEVYKCSAGCSLGACLDANYASVNFAVKDENGPAEGVIVASQGGKGYSCLTDYYGKCQISNMEKGSYTALVNDPLYNCTSPGCPKNFDVFTADNTVEITLQKKYSNPQIQTCTDRDGGHNFTEKGAVKVIRQNQPEPQVFIDYCFSDAKTLKEGFCDGDFIATESYVCDNGCLDGACLSQLPPQPPAPFCGDNVCLLPETYETCLEDCPAPAKACSDCGTFCNQTKCLSLGIDCFFANNKCFDQRDIQGNVSLQVQVLSTQGYTSPINNAIVEAYSVGVPTVTCPTNIQGVCNLDLALAKQYSIIVSAKGYKQSPPIARQPFSQSEPPLVVYLQPLPPVEPPPQGTEVDIVFEVIDAVATSKTGVKQAVSDANVVVKETSSTASKSCQTNSFGACTLRLARDKAYDFTTKAEGYNDYVSGLSIGQSYETQVLVALTPVSIPTIPPVAPASNNVYQAIDNNIELIAGRMAIKLSVLRNVLPVPTAICIIQAKPSVGGSVALQIGTGQVVGSYTFDAKCYDQNNIEIHNFAGDIKIEIRYNDSLLPAGVDENNLAIYFYNTQTQQWESLEIVSRDTKNNIIIAKSNHLTDLVLAAGVHGGADEYHGDLPTKAGKLGEICCNSAQEWTKFTPTEPKSAQGCDTADNLICYPDCFGETAARCLVGMKNGERVTASNPVSVCVKQGTVPICPFGISSIEDMIDNITKWIFYFAIILAPLFIVIGAVMFVTSGGDAARVTKAKQIIIWACIGLAIILFARGILSLIKNIIGIS